MKALVVDDHPLVREALRGVLKELEGGAEVFEASNCRQAMSVTAESPDLNLVLLDLNLPDRNGFDVLVELRQRYPAISVVVLSAFNNPDNVAKALELGALGFIPKSASRELMLSALRLVFSGGIYIPPDILARPTAATSEPARASARQVPPGDLGLTDRQLEVLALMMQGKSNKLICRKLGLAEATVKSHVTAILRALNVSNRTEAVIAVSALGWDLPRLDP